MVQRLGIAQALLGNPDLLVLDEPTSGLDPAGRKEVRDLIVTLKAEGKTIFLSSHILSEVEQICDRVIIVDHGGLIRAGGLQEILASDNRIEIVVDHLPDHLKAAIRDFSTSVSREADDVRICVEAAHKRVVAETLWAGDCDVISLTPMKNSGMIVNTRKLSSIPVSPYSNSHFEVQRRPDRQVRVDPLCFSHACHKRRLEEAACFIGRWYF